MTVATAPDFSLSNVCVCVCHVCVCVCTISCWITRDIFLGVIDDITTSFFPFDVHGTLVQSWVTHHVIFNQSCHIDVMASAHLVDAGTLWHDIMISSRWVLWYPSTPTNHPQRYLPNTQVSLMSTDITRHVDGFRHDTMFSPRSLLLYPCAPMIHPQRYFQNMLTCVIDAGITTQIGGVSLDTVLTFNCPII